MPTVVIKKAKPAALVLAANEAGQTLAHYDNAKNDHEDLKNKVRKVIDDHFQDSSVLDKVNDYPKFLQTELKLGSILGKGGFGTGTYPQNSTTTSVCCLLDCTSRPFLCFCLSQSTPSKSLTFLKPT